MKPDAPEVTFEQLDKWSQMTDAELEAIYSHDAAATLGFILRDLAPPERASESVTAKNFPQLVREMRAAKRTGSRALGDAIIKAADLGDQGDLDAARRVYMDFLATSPSAFYRRVAQAQLANLQDPTNARRNKGP